MPRKKKKSKEEDDMDVIIQDSGIPEKTMRAMWLVVLGVLTLTLIVGFIKPSGLLGSFLDTFTGVLFGYVRYIVPAFVVLIGYYIYKSDKYNFRWINWLGMGMVFLSFVGFFHLRVDYKDAWQTVEDGKGGGFFGFLVDLPFRALFGGIVTFISLAAILLIGVFLWFRISFHEIVNLIRNKKKKDLEEVFGKEGVDLGSDYAKATSDRDDHMVGRKEGEDLDDDVEEDDEEQEKKSKLWDALKGPMDKLLKKGKSEVDLRKDEDDEEDDYDDDSGEHDENETDASDAEDNEIEEDGVDNENGEDIVSPEIALEDSTVLLSRANKQVVRGFSLDLLDKTTDKATATKISVNKAKIQATLRSFGIDVEMGDVTVGPTVTQYTLRPAQGVKLSKITALNNDLALALATHPIRIEAPIPGKSLVGIELPNKQKAVVRLKELVAFKDYRKGDTPLEFPVGRAVNGKGFYAVLPKMPHMLIAGSTGSGKSVCINAMLSSLLFKHTSQELKIIMVDPKRVELTGYNGIPHLLTPVITDVKKCVNALKWAVSEMDRRYELLEKVGKKNIASFNEWSREKMPYIVIVIDELADLMSTMAKEVEPVIIRLAQMARAVGIHLVLATQRPSVDVITGLIKANITSRIAFSTASVMDSRTILDSSGAEKLLGRGDMLFITAELGRPIRLQGAFVSEAESTRIVDYLKKREKPEYANEVLEDPKLSRSTNQVGGLVDDEIDPFFWDAKDMVINVGKASTSYLQRRLKVGYSRAARIMDLLEQEGVIGPADGSRARKVLINQTESGLNVKDDSSEDDV